MSSFPLQSWLQAQQQRVQSLLQTRMDAIARRSPARLADAMSYSLLHGGKRMRPVLCLTFADSVARASNGGGAPADDAAWALECVHAYSLVHDDLPAMDDDELRRGRPTNHKVYGEAMAILAGDALLTEAFSLLASGPPSERWLRCTLISELATASGAGGMVGGQVLDIAEDRTAELEYLHRLHHMKTGALIRAACRMGAIAGGADGAALQAAEVYGESVGLAFQIADDILDATASASAMGKPTRADAAAGRQTYPAVIGLEAARKLAEEYVRRGLSAVAELDSGEGALAALARHSIDRAN